MYNPPVHVLAALVATVLALTGASTKIDNTDCAAARSILDEKNGFRDVKLRAQVADIPGLKPTDISPIDRDRFKTKFLRAYARPADDLNIFGERLSSITYLVYNDQVFAIDLRWGGNTNGLTVLESFERALGCPRQFKLGDVKADVEIEASGQLVSFIAWHRTVKNVGSFGEAVFEDRGLLNLVNEQVRREAADQF